MKFATKLSLSVTAAAFVAVPLLGLSISRMARDIVSEAIVNEELVAARHLSGDIEQLLARADAGLQVIGQDVFLRRYLAPSGIPFTNEARRDLAEEFEQRGKVTGPWLAVMAFGRDGTIVLSTSATDVGRNISDFAAGRQVHQAVLRGEKYRSDVLPIDKGGRQAIVLAMPVMSEDHTRVSGAVMGYFDWTAIQRVLDQTSRSSHAYLIANDGQVLATSSDERKRMLHQHLSRSALLDTARTGKPASGILTLEQGATPALVAAITVDRQNSATAPRWILLLATPLNVAFAPVDAMTRHIVFGVTAAMLAMAAIFYTMGRRLARPIEHLTAAMTEVVAGRLDSRARVESRDEVGTLASTFNRMIDDLGKQREELAAANNFLESVIDTSAGVIFAIDPTGRFEFVNERATELAGYSNDELLRQPFMMLIHPDMQDKVMTDFTTILQGETVHAHEAMLLRKDGTSRWIEYSAGPVKEGEEFVRIVGAATDITLRKQLQATLQESNELLKFVVENVPARIFWKDRESRYLGCNTTLAKDAGYSSAEELIGKTDFDMGWKDQAELYRTDDKAVMESGQPRIGIEEPQTTPDGGTIWLHTSKVPLRGVNGQVIGILGIYEDVTERKRAMLAIEASERKLRAVLDATTEGILMVDAQTRQVVLPNRAICDMLGYSAEEIAKLDVDDIHPAESLPFVMRQFERQAQGEIRLAMDMPVQRKDGSVFFADITSSPTQLGGRECLVGAFHDITERKRAEETLQKSEELYRSLVENTSDIVWEVDATGVYTYVSSRIHEMLGYTPDEIIGKKPFDLMPPEESQRMAGKFATLVAGSLPIRSIENINRHKDGHLVTLETSGVPFYLPDGSLGGYRGIDRDITERIRSRHELELKNAMLTTQQELSPDGILVVDAAARIVYYNQRFISLWDIPPALVATGDDEPVLRHVVGKQADPEAFLAQVRTIFESRAEKSHDELHLADGGTVERYSAPMFGANGAYYGRAWYFRDITERKRNEEIIKASLAEKEALLREIHHRVKNNMQVVISLLNLEVGKIVDPTVVQMLRDGQRRIEVMALVHEKLHQSRNLDKVDAKSYIEDLARSSFNASERSGAQVRLTLAVETIGLGLDAATPCGLIINELISNALKHGFPDGRAGEIRVALRALPDREIELVVADDGIGMPVQFDWRNARSLGLRLVRNLVERQLQGRIELDRTAGTVWKIAFKML